MSVKLRKLKRKEQKMDIDTVVQTAATPVVDVKAEIDALLGHNDEYRKQIKENKVRIASLKVLVPKVGKGRKKLTDEEKAARVAAKEADKTAKKAAREAKKAAKLAEKAAKTLASGGKRGRPKMTDEQKAAAKAAREAAKAATVTTAAPVAVPDIPAQVETPVAE